MTPMFDRQFIYRDDFFETGSSAVHLSSYGPIEATLDTGGYRMLMKRHPFADCGVGY